MRLNSSMMRSVPPIWILILLALALWGGEFIRRGLWEPDEARYAYVAREMHDSGNWFVPHVNGKPYPDKPPLMFWLINASSLFTGGRINGVSARLPSLLGSILTLWVITRLLARWHSEEAAWRAMLILLTSFLFWKTGGWGQIDALLCGLVMMSVYFFFSSLDNHQTRREILAYSFAGLAVLAKGPVGLVVPMGIFAIGAVTTRQSYKLKRYHWLWGPVIALAIPALWLGIALLQHPPPEYFAAMFGEKSFGRVVASHGHNRPFYYFLYYFPLEFLPWTIFLPAAVVSLSKKMLKRRLLGWLIFVIALFSMFVCKRNIYILAAYPAAAMLIGAAWRDMSHLSRRWTMATGVAAIGLVWLLAGMVTVAIFVPHIPFNRLNIIPSSCVLICGGILLTRVFRQEKLSQRWLLLFCGVFLLFQVTVSAVVLPAINNLKGPVKAAEALKARLKSDQPVYLYQYQLAIIPLYADRPGRELHSVEELKSVISEQTNAVVVFRERQWQELRPEFGCLGKVHEFKMGHKHMKWVEF